MSWSQKIPERPGFYWVVEDRLSDDSGIIVEAKNLDGFVAFYRTGEIDRWEPYNGVWFHKARFP